MLATLSQSEVDTTNQLSYTENGAIGYKTSGKELLDINFAISSMRNMNEEDIRRKYLRVFNEDKILAVKWLFYARDCRSGVGERRLFRICLELLSQNHIDIARAVLSLVPEYGRWDDLFVLMKGNLQDDVFKIVKNQLKKDKINMNENKSISLCAKWMPSGNTSSKETRQLARIFIKKFKCSEKKYRQLLSKFRSYLKVIEVAMSAKKWDEINYAAVPSRANLIYKKAFLRNDRERRLEYLEKLKKGETKINSEVLFPHDIVHQYGTYNMNVDDTLEELWKGLPDYVQGNGNTICVVDTSGSMTTRASSNSSVSCMEVAYALGVYFSEKSSGKFKNKFITFSSSPILVDFSNAKTLREKLNIIDKHSICSNTNIEAVFDLILSHAKNNKLGQEELPNNILILSDCEFDSMVNINRGERPTNTFFDNMKIRFKNNGYILPRLVFWNICGRSGTIPVQNNSLGVALVSGFSPAVTKMVLSNKTDPFECLLEQLNDKRYQPVEDAIKDIISKSS
ncbi:hypothetical protein H8356DRAFT_1365146 [Neocallimastix lanati (nom. inval.)]|uniref:Uncharacterized protein n=1 Tax=Neocallimastix californiae TaxID=1754190 RepID=A0A1Y2C6M0_9FUNG|nr:hypothetical protein H8356DRAFT_1365146 [Neocallimastix sp. JGI-2020a]ORY42692.1 hypothetical protein LY90DRAFT_417660 [Neocallimastix californiae]|eukprot:ORY42692.1 hypothetical protein LY90DRAFT_417660 [Neocallimastix californiae]